MDPTAWQMPVKINNAYNIYFVGDTIDRAESAGVDSVLLGELNAAQAIVVVVVALRGRSEGDNKSEEEGNQSFDHGDKRRLDCAYT